MANVIASVWIASYHGHHIFIPAWVLFVIVYEKMTIGSNRSR